jgi:hypothetical protein
MRKPKRIVTVALSAIVAAITVGAPSVANAAVPYPAGSAVAAKPGYSVPLWAKVWSCAYAGWSSPPKDWDCWLYEPTYNTRLSSRSGTFSGSGFTTPTYYYLTNNVYLCVHAEANYQDGSSGDSDNKCG